MISIHGDIVLLPVLFFLKSTFGDIWSMIYSMQRELHTLKALENQVLNSENCVPVFQNRFVVISDFRLTGHACNIVRRTLCCTGNQKLTAQLAKNKSWQSPSVDVTPLEIE